MRKGFACLLFLALALPRAYAHRLNEYLQATTIMASDSSLMLEIRLTPGTDVAPLILKKMDRNGDGKISIAEQRDYVSQLSASLSLVLDGENRALTAKRWNFPDPEKFLKGLEKIMVHYDVSIRQKKSQHHLKFSNTHFSAFAVYLVNCLLPFEKNVSIISQDRNIDQSVYAMDFSTSPSDSGHSAPGKAAASGGLALTWTFFVHGIRHILTGYDHLLFLCALVLATSSLWELIKVVTAFTVAHSITLALATFGLAHLSLQIVEPLISLSIIYVAVVNIAWPKQASGSPRLAAAFFFGLFHGLGFAGELLDLMQEMPHTLIILALIGFSLGVEAGNQLVLLPLYSFLMLLTKKSVTRTANRRMQIFKILCSAVVALAGIYYLLISFTSK